MTTLNADTGASPGDRDQPMSHNGSRPPPERFVLDRAEQLAQTGSWDWNLEADVLLWSDNMFRLLGLEPDEITPTPGYVIARVHPDDRERVEQELEAARAVGILPDVTFRTTMPDGSVRSLRSLAAVADESDGRPSRLIGSVQDVTELAEAMRKSEESLTLIETLQSTAPVGFAFVDREFRIIRINQALADVNGGPLEDQLGHLVAEVVPDVWSQMEPVYRSVLDTGVPVVNLEVDRERGATGDRRHWLASYYPVIIDAEVVGVGVVVVDITDRKEAEDFSSAVMDTMVEGLYTLDVEGRLTFMNAAASRILGWTEEELRGRDMHAAIHFQNADGSPHPHEDCALLAVRIQGRSVRMAHDAFTCKGGTICPVAYSSAPLMDGTTIRGVVVVFRDTSMEHAEEDRVRRALDALAWVGRIRDALDTDRFVLHSQPIVPLAGGQPSQELLLRMVGPGGELIPPGSFLPVAERYGLIGEIAG
jgi:PAS domain S-box-containing protein